MKDGIHTFDRVVGGWVARLPLWMRPLMHVFTWLGEPPITVGISAVVLGYGLALSKPTYITAGAIAMATIAVASLLKLFLRRARPITEYVEKMFFKTYSFPSGHAAGALVSYGLAAFVISIRWPEFAIAAWLSALFMTFCVSLSRIYLGAHYPSDILGGWLVGALGLIAIITTQA
jgi:undecaprenyl-diphosphatase